jgi:decaprenyl-phosphate phosphoribosyltransferase
MRPKQWIKNLLVIAAPLASGELFRLSNLPVVIITFLAFCAASSSVYLLNDILDRELDRVHSKKRNRPIASGRLPVNLAGAAAIVLAIGALVIPVTQGLPNLALVLAVYLTVQVLYCVWLKNVAVLDLAVVSSGFLIRAIAGGVALGIVLSQWFLLVAAFGSLFMVAGKRYSEKVSEEGGRSARPIMEAYTPGFLRSIWIIAAAMVLMSYSLWAFELGETSEVQLGMASLAPFTIALLRYAFDIDGGRAGSPEDTVLKDRVLLLMGALWATLFVASVLLR